MKSITVLVPALNEEANLAEAVRGACAVARDCFADYEVIVVNDGSADHTGEVAERLAREDPRVRALHNPAPRGLGYNYRLGVERGTKEFYVMVPGDNENPAELMRGVFERAGAADVILPFVVNAEVRSRGRRVLSRLYTGIVNALFGLSLPYYNGPVLHRRALLAALPPWTAGFAFQTEILVRLLARGVSWEPVPIRIQRVQGSVTKAFRVRNVASVGATLARLFWRVQVAGRFSPRPSTHPPASLSASRSSSGSR